MASWFCYPSAKVNKILREPPNNGWRFAIFYKFAAEMTNDKK
jgi:hypothetical protein